MENVDIIRAWPLSRNSLNIYTSVFGFKEMPKKCGAVRRSLGYNVIIFIT